MNRGYVKLYRKSLDAGWIKSHKLWAFWCWCLMKASHKEYDAVVGLQTVHLMPGQFIFGRKKAAEETGLTEKEVRTRLNFLDSQQNVAIKTANKFSVVTIVNWDTYQGECFTEGQQQGKQVATYKNVKKNIYSENSLAVLAYLNQQTGKKYRDASFIETRLKDGGSVDDCRKIIDTKMKDPFFIDNPKFLCPKTLFCKSHWDQYLNEAVPPTAEGGRSWFKTDKAENCHV